jgi:hypothetical protein
MEFQPLKQPITFISNNINRNNDPQFIMLVLVQVENGVEPFWKKQIHVINEKTRNLVFSFWI